MLVIFIDISFLKAEFLFYEKKVILEEFYMKFQISAHITGNILK